MDASVTVEAMIPTRLSMKNTSNKSVMVGPWENLLKVANSTLLVKSQFLNVFFKFYANLIDIDHTNKIQDPENPDLKRYLRFENDPAIGWSLVGSGTQTQISLCTSTVSSHLCIKTL